MIETDRLVLSPLVVADAGAMVSVLASPELYHFMGGRSPSLDELEKRYAFQVGGDPVGTERWFNWIVRRSSDDEAIGFVQATVTTVTDDSTVTDDAAGESAELAWVIGTAFQGEGFAIEAARAVRRSLELDGITAFTATIHPGHAASEAVASAIGLERTASVVDGEVVWSS